MNKHARILIVGAGPSGLTLAVELHRHGFTNVRVVEKLTKLTTRGRALAIIPKTLAYLEDSEVTDLILAKAQTVNHIQLCKDGQVQNLQLSGIHPTYDHMTTLEQEEIERCLIARLKHYGGKVDRGVELTGIDAERREAILTKAGKKETYGYDLLVGADGVGSTVRQLMGFAFDGEDVADAWEQMEIEVKQKARGDAPLMLFLDQPPLLGAIPAPNGVYRVVTPTLGVEERFAERAQEYETFTLGKVLWKSRFRVGYRSAEEMYEEQVVLLGDAANVHSPVGGRGMNKGIEDAFLLAQSLATGEDVNRWERRRKRVDRFLVRRVRLASWVISRKGRMGAFVAWLIFRFPTGFKSFILNSVLR